MNIFFSILIVVFIVLLLVILATWLDAKEKVKFIETVFDKVSPLYDSKTEEVTDHREAGPWYLVVYTKDSNYPVWISNNTIRSVHPDPEHCKIIVKQFNGEDMVIENVENFRWSSASEM